jgi:hypothetical protein
MQNLVVAEMQNLVVAEMQNLASSPDSAWLDILSRLPCDLHLDQLARDTGAIRRVRNITDAADLLRLGLARGPGGKTLKQTAAWSRMSGVAELSAPSLAVRLHQSVGFFAAVTSRLLAAGRPPAKPALWRGRCLHLCDGRSRSRDRKRRSRRKTNRTRTTTNPRS